MAMYPPAFARLHGRVEHENFTYDGETRFRPFDVVPVRLLGGPLSGGLHSPCQAAEMLSVGDLVELGSDGFWRKSSYRED